MRTGRRVTIFLMSLLVITILSMSSVAQAQQNKKYYFIATEGIIDPESNYHHFIDTWTGNGLEERIVNFEWYMSHKDNIVSASSQGLKLGGVKAEFKVYAEGNDIFLYMRIYKGSYSSPKISETIVWQVLNGKDSTNDRITSILMSIETGRLSKTVTLTVGGDETISLPYSYTYSCRMWLM